MAREGTRSQTGNSKPRLFPVVDTAPVRKQNTTTTTTAKKPKTTSTAAKAAKPVGVTKKKATTAKKGPSVATKVCSLCILSALYVLEARSSLSLHHNYLQIVLFLVTTLIFGFSPIMLCSCSGILGNQVAPPTRNQYFCPNSMT